MRLRNAQIIVLVSVAMSTAVFAHSGVKDPVVKARMDLMGSIAQTTKTLGTMAKSGDVDPAQVVEAANALAAHAREIEPKFSEPATDPKSEALPVIWEEMNDFLNIAKSMETAALNLAGAPDDLANGMKEIGRTCGTCHKDYRIEK